MNEIFRRVEPEKRTMSEYMAQVLKEKENFEFDIVIGA